MASIPSLESVAVGWDQAALQPRAGEPMILAAKRKEAALMPGRVIVDAIKA